MFVILFAITAIVFTVITISITKSSVRVLKWLPVANLHDPDFEIKEGNIYFQGEPFPNGIDLPTFVVAINKTGLPTPYSKDKNHVYYIVERPFEDIQIKIMPEADPTTFQPIFNVGGIGLDAGSFAKDSNTVFVEDVPIPGADPETFVVLNEPEICGPECEYNAKDKNHFYLGPQIVK
jgi:hypothetical protein